ncbi:MAG: antitoxin Xre/MbcA/ParS toxin-binding domain-containing protein [Gemmataceae bacterium]
MGMKVELPTILAHVRNEICSRNAPHWNECETCSGPGLPCTAEDLDEQIIADLLNDMDQGRPAFREFLDGMKCERCLLVLALKGVEKVLPGRMGVAWMNTANPDLDGRTPMEALEARKFRSVIDALWLADPDSDAG